MKVKRYLGDQPGVYRVIGLVMVKSDVDMATGEQILDMDLRMGSFEDPVKFIEAFQYAQRAMEKPLN